MIWSSAGFLLVSYSWMDMSLSAKKKNRKEVTCVVDRNADREQITIPTPSLVKLQSVLNINICFLVAERHIFCSVML